MNKELIQKQKKFLGLFFGMWALLILNSAIGYYLIESDATQTNLLHGDGVAFGVFAFTIFQTWAIYKYILKK